MTHACIALISRFVKARAHLAAYLRASRFEVYECDDLEIPTRFAALVIMIDSMSAPEDVRARVGRWLTARRCKRIIVVTSELAAWSNLVAVHSDRLVVLHAPVLSWEIASALRGHSPSTPFYG